MTDLDAIMAKVAGAEACLSDLRDRAARADAETVKLKGQVAALSGRVIALERAEPSKAGLPVDPCGMPEADRLAMVERMRAGTATGIEANKADRYRAGRTYRKDSNVK